MPLSTDKNRPWKKTGWLPLQLSEQLFQRTYPVESSEVAEAVTLAAETTDGAPREARACGSHWGISECAVTKGTMIETATPVFELDCYQDAGRLNEIQAARDVTKTNTSRVETFKSGELGFLGYADSDGKVAFLREPVPR